MDRLGRAEIDTRKWGYIDVRMRAVRIRQDQRKG